MTRFAFANQLLKELRDSRLWPLALALLVALVAIPILLSKPAKNPSTTGATSPPASAASALADLKPIVTVTSASAQSERKSVNRLSRKNPFTPLGGAQSQSVGGSSSSGLAATASVGATGGSGAATTGSTQTAGSTSGSLGSTGGGSTGSTGSTGGGSTGTSGGKSTTFYYTYVADVRFGEVDNGKQYDVKQLRALPSSDLPIVVFMGATSGGDSAVFLVASGAAVTGEGKCKPSDEDCVFLYLKPDETASIAVGDATGALTTYELKLREIKVEKLDQPPTASGASAKASKKATARRQARSSRARAKGFFQLFGQLGF